MAGPCPADPPSPGRPYAPPSARTHVLPSSLIRCGSLPLVSVLSDTQAVSPAPRLVEDFDQTLARLADAPAFSKYTHQSQLLVRTAKLLKAPGGVAVLADRAEGFDAAGVFAGTDWDMPAGLQPGLVGPTLRAGGDAATLECLSELRLLAIAEARTPHADLSAEAARTFLAEAMAANLDLLFGEATEASRERSAADRARLHGLFDLLAHRLGMGLILDRLLAEVAEIMAQRPIMRDRAVALIQAAGQALTQTRVDDSVAAMTRHWLSAIEAPSVLAQAEGDGYAAALAACDAEQLAAEAGVFAASMNETGLVARDHAVLVRHLSVHAPALIPAALGCNAIGEAAYAAHAAAIGALIDQAITPDTAHAIYGLSRLLSAGLVLQRPVLPGLQRLARLELHPEAVAALLPEAPADHEGARTRLLAGACAVLGQPRGVDQGHNPTCQSARAISLWAQNDPGYLLELVASAARDHDIVMDFEGQLMHSAGLDAGMAKTLHTELDALSRLLTPHIDRLYVEMGRHTVGRPGDGHRWINPEMHGWWVTRDFAALIELSSNAITDCSDFIRAFYSAYHPAYNGDRALAYIQPCGIAATTSSGDWIGWHAIAIQRVARDETGAWRVYFYNPNRDKAQNWGHGIVTSTDGHGELEGESSLVFEDFAARLYVFHYRSAETGDPGRVPEATITSVRAAIAASWGRHFQWHDR